MDLVKLLLKRKYNSIKEIRIGFVGNCQTVYLNFLLEELLKNNSQYITKWCCYNIKTAYFANVKSKNKIKDHNEGINYLKECDFIIYQHILPQTSEFFSTDCILKYKKNTCVLISMPSIHFDITNYDSSLLELQRRESINNVTISVSNIIQENKNQRLFIDIIHPTPFLFLEIFKKICSLMNINSFTNEQYNFFMKENNTMKNFNFIKNKIDFFIFKNII